MTVDPTRVQFGDDELRHLGMRLRSLREARGWSLRRLAGLSEVSVAAIQSIEQAQSSPGFLTILALADTLGIGVDALIDECRQATRRVATVTGRLRSVRTGTADLTGPLHEPGMRARLLRIPARGSVRAADLPVEPRLFACVLDGVADAAFADGSVERLGPGDALHVTDGAPIAWRNPRARPAQVLCLSDRRGHEGEDRHAAPGRGSNTPAPARRSRNPALARGSNTPLEDPR